MASMIDVFLTVVVVVMFGLVVLGGIRWVLLWLVQLGRDVYEIVTGKKRHEG